MLLPEVIKMLDNSYRQLGLSALLEQDLTSYEFFYSLPKNIQQKIERRDFGSFQEMQDYVNSLRS